MPSDSKEWRIHFLSATVLFLVITKEARFFKCVSLRNLFTAEYEAVGRSAFQQIMEIVAFKDSLGNVSKSTSARCTLHTFFRSVETHAARWRLPADLTSN
jgi:hypothetical protein